MDKEHGKPGGEFHRYFLDLQRNLINERNADGYWTGRLSTSALSTAVALVALKVAGTQDFRDRIRAGLAWLAANINADGGYGDTPESESNLSTTLLCYAAVRYCVGEYYCQSLVLAIESYLESKGLKIDEPGVVENILKIYGRDYTFSVPILAMLFLCGAIPPDSLDRIPSLPFEFSLLPAGLYRFFNLRVVSYALPALIAVGIFLHRKRNRGNLLSMKIREAFVKPVLRKLESLVPPSGGFLEAIPLTGFVAMCLAASGEKESAVVGKGLYFLQNQQRNEGGWPIDTNLSTWVTTLSVKALGPQLRDTLGKEDLQGLREHLLDLQFKETHPFNGARSGAWGWTNQLGSVPDADDTPGAILALLEMYSGSERENQALLDGCAWLLNLQNRDGGFPTFCKGWGRLPFDRSCADLTGHAWLALNRTQKTLGNKIPRNLGRKMDRSMGRALVYLQRHQKNDGSWVPLWFGNQQVDDKSNPVYGTAKVSIYLSDGLSDPPIQPGNNEGSGNFSGSSERIAGMLRSAQSWLLGQQNPDGSWGGLQGIPGSIEETALAVSALSGQGNNETRKDACRKGLQWLRAYESLPAAPIGLYFALLWYDEKLYPLIYQAEAFRRNLQNFKRL
jgi:squalene-hopene/tetraprenyl-beta-curcumene cyclase